MKKIILFLVVTAIFSACITKTTTELQPFENFKGTAVYGDSIKDENVLDLEAVSTAMQNESKMDMKVRGRVDEVCQKKGCWMTMRLTNGEAMHITFKDYKLFMPKNLSGKEVILDGFAHADTVSIEDQKHYAKDAGKSAAEISRITTPKAQLAFEAKGVVVL